MKHIYVGEIVNTHGLKGELKILSEFKHKDKIFTPGFKFYVGNRKEELTLIKYRHHKVYDMVMFDGVDSIDDAIPYKGDSIYINRTDIEVDDYFTEELIGLDVYNKEELIGTVETIMKNNAHEIIVVSGKEKKHMIPYVDEFVKKIDLDNSKIIIETIDGMLNEN